MAPEMATAKGEYLGPWTDVYLLGGILHEILTGEMPHQGASLYKVVKAAFKSEPKEYGPQVPEELARICRKSMARKLKDRYQRVEEFQQALRDFLRHRESHAIVASSDRKLDDISERTGQLSQRGESRNAVYQTLAEALAGYRQAQVLWDGNETAVAGERRARLLFARKAFESGDFGLARSHLEGLQDEPEARSLHRSIDGELAARVRDEASTQRTKKAGMAAAVLLVVGLSTAVVVVAMEKSRASSSERQARALAQEAQANLVRAQDSELIARRAAKEAEASARLAADEARAKALALDQIQAEKSRADVSERKATRMAQQATHNASEAKRREKEARAALDKARTAERRAKTLARQARAEAREKTEALGEVQRLADLVLLQRLQRGGETLISRPGDGGSGVANWVADARDLVSRLSSHRQALVKFQLTASKGRDGIGRDLKRLEGLIGQLDRKRTALEVVARSAAETQSQRTEIARLEENLNQLQVKAAGFSGYRFDGERDRWRYQTLRELVAGLEDLQRPGGLLERVRAVGRGN